MAESFRRPVGSQADVKELEYIAALHQTCLPSCRQDGTVSSLDVVRFLRSRVGIFITHAEAIRVVQGLGGGVIGDEVIEQILAQQEQVNAKTPEAVVQKRRVQQATQAIKARIFRAKKAEQLELELEREPEEEKQGEKEESQQVDDDNNNNDDDDKEKDELEEPEEFLDIVQLTAAILIPTMARAGKEWHQSRNDNVDRFQDETVGTAPTDIDSEVFQTLRPKPETLFKDTLSILLRSAPDDAFSDNEESESGALAYPKLTPDLIRKLLLAYDEHERAADSNLVEQMVEAASSASGLLDEEALVHALTSDLSDYPVESEDRETTGFYDVFGYESYREKERAEAEERAALQEQADSDINVADLPSANEQDSSNMENFKTTEPYKLTVRRIMSPIDFAVDAHSSVVLVTLIWIFFVLMAVTYATLFQTMEALQLSCDKKTFGCQLAGTVITWVVFALILVATGYVIVIPLSLGNSPRRRSPRNTLFALLASILFNWIPYIVVEQYESNAKEPYNDAEEAVQSRNWDRSQWIVRAIGNILSLFLLLQFILAVIGNRSIRDFIFLSRWFTTSNVRGAARTKKAATRKLNKLLQNAHSLHSLSSGKSVGKSFTSLRSSISGTDAMEQTMLNYTLHGEKKEDCGGLIWTWKKLLSGALFDEEGVWIFSRLIVFQFAQIILAVFVSYSAFLFVEWVADEADKFEADMRDDLPDWVYQLVPSSSEARAALYPAVAVSMLVMICLILIYLPSCVGTTLKYRCGLLPSLNSPYFTKYRTNVDLVYGNIGNAFFALIGSAFLFFFLVALVLFLIVWEFTRDFMILIIAWGIGLTITIVLKMLLTKACRTRFYAGFYRTKPRSANLSTLALECWFIGLGGGVLIGRFTQFILAACFWVGRTDVPFLSEDVRIMGYAFDYVPTNFWKDLLVHDAHHHPYLERLFTMYLMKLKSPGFCSDAGACWRQLFVVSWMPWLMKNRVFSDKRIADAIDSYNERRLQREEETKQKTIGEEIQTGLNIMLDQVIDERPAPKKDDSSVGSHEA